MAEYITIDQAVEAVTKTQGLRGDALRALYDIPTIDIVHCSECKYSRSFFTDRQACENPRHKKQYHDSDWFCADGKRV